MKISLETFIKKVRWQTAKDGSHQYTILKWHPELENEFRAFAAAVQKEGYKDKFQGMSYIYLRVGNYVYWTMSYPIVLINRRFDTNTLKQTY